MQEIANLPHASAVYFLAWLDTLTHQFAFFSFWFESLGVFFHFGSSYAYSYWGSTTISTSSFIGSAAVLSDKFICTSVNKEVSLVESAI